MNVFLSLALLFYPAAPMVQDGTALKSPPVKKTAPFSEIVYVKRGTPGLWKRLRDGTVSRLTDQSDRLPSFSAGRIYFTRRQSGEDSAYSILPDGTDLKIARPRVSGLTVQNSVWAWLEFLPTAKQSDGSPHWKFVARTPNSQRILATTLPNATTNLPATTVAPGKSGRVPIGTIVLDSDGSRAFLVFRTTYSSNLPGQNRSSETYDVLGFETGSGTEVKLRRGDAKAVVAVAGLRSRLVAGCLGVLDTESGRLLCNLSAENDPIVLHRAFPPVARLSVSTSGRLLYVADGSIFVANSDGSGATNLMAGSDAVWLD